LINKIKNKLSKDIHLFELLKGASISLIFQVFGILLGYVFIFLLSKYYGAEGMGIFSLSFALLNIFVLFGKFGLDTATVKLTSEYSSVNEISGIKDIYFKILIIMIPINIVLTFLLFFLAPYIADNIFNKPYLSIYFQIIAFGILPMSLRFLNANNLRAIKYISSYSFLQSISLYLIASILLLFSVFFMEKSLNTVLYIIVISLFIGMIISFIIWFKNSHILTKNRKEVISIKNILKISTPMLIASSIMLIMSWSDTIMLGIFRTEAEVGVYNIAYKISAIVLLIFMAISTISAPKLASSYGNNNMSEFKKIAFKSTKLIFIFSLPIFLFIIIFHNFLLGLFGKEFLLGAWTLIFLVSGQLIKSIFGTLDYILQMSNQQKPLMIYALTSAIINVLLNYIFIPIYGIEGAAIASMISIFIYQSLLLLKVKKEFGFYLFINIKKLFTKRINIEF